MKLNILSVCRSNDVLFFARSCSRFFKFHLFIQQFQKKVLVTLAQRRRITCAICAMFSDFDADPLLIHPSLNHGMGIVAAAQILKEKSVALDPLADFLIVFCKIAWF